MLEYIVSKQEAGNRLDIYITQKDKEITRTSAQRLIEEENIL